MLGSGETRGPMRVLPAGLLVAGGLGQVVTGALGWALDCHPLPEVWRLALFVSLLGLGLVLFQDLWEVVRHLATSDQNLTGGSHPDDGAP